MINKIKLLLLIIGSFTLMSALINPTMFIGQLVAGAQPGSPLYVDTNGLLTGGELQPTVVSATTDINVTTVSHGTTVLSLTNPISGTYQVDFRSTIMSNGSNNADTGCAIFQGTFLIQSSIQSATATLQGGLTPALPQKSPIGAMAEVTVNGSQNIEARCGRTAGTSVLGRRVMIIRRTR